ncbi:MAG: SusD/RagB family nutrient-binding outer membrane lipoprotein [Cyclobacteriaceae bacterium]|nr:SusD/RagB family nutrient-binding outer membrane lipoprotein [Cyclobacteriaceae bacterium]
MKNIIITFTLLMLAMASCQDLQEINENPNNVSETHPQLLLITAEWDAFNVEGTEPLYAARMLVQTDGESENQWYKWNRTDFGDYGKLRTVTKMIEEAQRIENSSYEALGKFFRAYYFYKMTLTFGDIPYQNALQGESNEIYTPAYDSQQAVFAGILTELEEADAMLKNDNSIILGDIIYDGSTLKWRKLINSFRLKVLMTLSKKESVPGFDIKASFANIVANAPLIESNADNGQLEYLDQTNSRYSEYNSSGYGSGMYMDSTFIKRLQDRQDPRLFIYCDRTKNAKEAGLAINDFAAYEGGNPIAPYAEVNTKAAQGNASKVNLRYTTDPTNEPHMLLGYSELQLILAEASLRGWINPAKAEEYYQKGVEASFEFYNMHADDAISFVDAIDAQNYLDGELVKLSDDLSKEEKIERVIMQKYLQSFLQGGWSMYFDHLRTGYPSFLSLPNVAPPRRWMYPTAEYQENEAHVSEAIAAQFGTGNDKTNELTWWLK